MESKKGDRVNSYEVPNGMGQVFSQVGGNHYQQKIPPVEFIHANDIPFIEGNVIKYVTRHKLKNKGEDIEKALQYCGMLLKLEYGYSKEQILAILNGGE